MGQIIVVGINIPKPHRKFNPVTPKRTPEQVKDLVLKIDSICKQLSEKESHAEHWILAWRECSITDLNSELVSKQDIGPFKQCMQELTIKYPKLILIAGTILSTREIQNQRLSERLKTVFDAYEETVAISEAESTFIPSQRQHLLHLGNAKQLSYDAIGLNRKINVVRNTCYIFQNGKCIARRDKTAPIQETRNSPASLFQPGNRKGNQSYINSLFGVEICREHDFSILKKECLSKSDSDNTPLIHFLLSDTIDANTDYAHGLYFIHLDSRQSTTFIHFDNAANKDGMNHTVKLYGIDYYDYGTTLQEVKPVLVIKQNSQDTPRMTP